MPVQTFVLTKLQFWGSRQCGAHSAPCCHYTRTLPLTPCQFFMKCLRFFWTKQKKQNSERATNSSNSTSSHFALRCLPPPPFPKLLNYLMWMATSLFVTSTIVLLVIHRPQEYFTAPHPTHTHTHTHTSLPLLTSATFSNSGLKTWQCPHQGA